jgi:hypothetical protein
MKKYVRTTNHKWEPDPDEIDFDYVENRELERVEEGTRAGILFVIMFILILLSILYKVII